MFEQKKVKSIKWLCNQSTIWTDLNESEISIFEMFFHRYNTVYPTPEITDKIWI